MAVQLNRAEHCSGCGLTEASFLEDPDAYVPAQVVCPWCALKDRARSDQDTDRSIPGSTIRLVPREAFERMTVTPAKRPRSRRERAKASQ